MAGRWKVSAGSHWHNSLTITQLNILLFLKWTDGKNHQILGSSNVRCVILLGQIKSVITILESVDIFFFKKKIFAWNAGVFSVWLWGPIIKVFVHRNSIKATCCTIINTGQPAAIEITFSKEEFQQKHSEPLPQTTSEKNSLCSPLE